MQINRIDNAFLTDETLINAYEDICKEHKKIIDTYLLKYKNGNLNLDIKETKYAIGGELLHRGYYCPSPVEDIIISNVKRGRLSNKLTDKIRYKYDFDKFGHLINVETIAEFTRREYIWYKDNLQYGVKTEGLEFSDYVSTTSRCLYENAKIIRYELALVMSKTDLGEYCIGDVEVEEYFYDDKNELINILKYTHFQYKGERMISNRYLYELIRDDDNKVISYKVLRIQDGKIISGGIISVPKYKQRVV